jgi:hypothetical protein
MDDGELMGKALYVAREAAGLLLRGHGAVLPFGLTLDSQGDNVRTYFPRDQWPSAEWNELIDAAVDHLARCIRSADVGVIALATELASGTQAGLGVQVETRSSSLFLLYPYIGTGRSRGLGEAQQADGLLVEPLLTGLKAR